MKDPSEGYIRLPIKMGVTDKCWRISEKTVRPASAWAVASCGRQWLEMALL